MRNITLTPDALDGMADWAKYEPKMLKRIFRIFEECGRTPFEGIGKPEALKGNLSVYWSRRIDNEHRLVYEVTEEEIIIHAVRDHY
jgi:toxin YoeB